MLTPEQTELIGTIRSLLDKLERSMSGVDGEDWKVGDTIEIVDNTTHHQFDIGDNVVVFFVDLNNPINTYECTGDKGDWYISKSEGRKVASGKVSE